jgi:IPT/TIG domain-containing protein/fibronectin type III domain protein
VVTPVSLSSLKLRWIDLAGNETGYEVERRAAGEGAFSPLAQLPPGSVEHIDAGLPQKSTYTYRVRAVNEFGASEFSAEVAGTTPWLPESPDSLSVILVASDSAGLVWTDRADNETGYELERKGPGEAQFGLLVRLGPGADSYHDGGLAPGSTYAYRVRAAGEFGFSGYSAIAVAVTTMAPPAPGGLDLVDFGPGRIRIAWEDRSGGTAGVEVERASGDDDFQLIASLDPGVEQFDDTAAVDGVEYRYRVRSASASGASGYTAEVRAMTAISVERVTPTSAPAVGGVPLTVTGMNFLAGTRVLLGGAPVAGLVRISLHELRGTVPPHAAGVVDIQVDNSGGQAILPGAFRYIGALLRGDVAPSGDIDISDPVALLDYLYLGGTIRCRELGNVNQDLDTDISDAVYLLGFLFFGGPAPSPETVECP